MIMAFLSSAAVSSLELLAVLKNDGFFQRPDEKKRVFLEDFSYMVGARNSGSEVGRYLNTLKRSHLSEGEQWQIAGVNGLVKGLEKNGQLTSEMKEKLKEMQVTTGEEAKTAIDHLVTFYEQL
jgi:hypothetical protein